MVGRRTKNWVTSYAIGVGGRRSVQRNRAKRRLREVARALWPRVPADGRQVVLIALSVVPTVDFGRLHDDVARLLRNLGVLDS